jgi:hypothetical protein
MDRRTQQNHRIVASEMTWDDLASIIIDLELEKQELRPFLKKIELKTYDQLLVIYQKEKVTRVEKLTTYKPWR